MGNKKELERMRFMYSDMVSKIAIIVNAFDERIKKIEKLYYAIQEATEKKVE